MSDPHLIARTRVLDNDVDLVALCRDEDFVVSSNNVGITGIGVVLRIPVPRSSGSIAARAVNEALSSIEVDDEVQRPGTGAVAIGAFPFAPRVNGELIVPRIALGRAEDGTCWITTISTIGEEPSPEETNTILRRSAVRGSGFSRDAEFQTIDDAPSSFDIHPLRTPDSWCSSVAAATQRLASGEGQKVVLARGIEIVTDQPVRPSVVLSHLRRSFPYSHLFCVDGFVGASPELLVQRSDAIVRAHPMAGTAPRSGDPEADARLGASLLSSTNTRDEHRHTIAMVHDTLLPWCSYLDEEAEPSIVALANVQHLGTRLEGRLSEPIASVLELVGALHPTPAVGGMPRDVALTMINELEGLERGRYAGPVGWVDGQGNGTWIVGIRSAQINDRSTIAYAGVGIVADSVPETELAETRAKLQTLLGAIVRP